MSANKRNFLVGITVIAAGCIFGWMFVNFGTKSAQLFAAPSMPVVFDAERVDGLNEGSPITYEGIVVGHVDTLRRDDSGTGVIITGQIAKSPGIPVNVEPDIVNTNLIGGGWSISLELLKDPKTKQEQPPQLLKPDDSGGYPRLHARYVGLKLDIIPTEFADTAGEIAEAAAGIKQTSDAIREHDLVKHLVDTLDNFSAQATKAGQTFDALQKIIGDPSVHSDLTQTLANARKASEDLDKFTAGLPEISKQATDVLAQAKGAIADTQGHVDDVSKQLGDSLTRASSLLDSMHDITDKINKGQGSAGLAVNDSKLYQALVDDSRELNTNLNVMQRLLEQWEQEGLSLKLK
jgi:ABC-type transporter Mla subunit MlaD